MLMWQRGFTLIEGMIVIAIMGIAFALAFPSFSEWLTNIGIRNSAEIMMNGIQQAKVEALRKNTRVSFWLVTLDDISTMDDSCTKSSLGSSWVVSVDDPEGVCATGVSETVAPRIAAVYAAGEGSRRASVSGTDVNGNAAHCVTFNGLGQIQAACPDGASPLARVAITSPEAGAATRNQEIRLSTGGIVRMCDPTVTTAGDPRAC